MNYVNNDTSPCASRTITFSVVVNSGLPGWTTSFDQTTVTLGIGATATTNLHVTSPVGAPAGSTTITVKATGAPDAAVAYVIASCGQAPVLSANPATIKTSLGSRRPSRSHSRTQIPRDAVGAHSHSAPPFRTLSRPTGR